MLAHQGIEIKGSPFTKKAGLAKKDPITARSPEDIGKLASPFPHIPMSDLTIHRKPRHTFMLHAALSTRRLHIFSSIPPPFFQYPCLSFFHKSAVTENQDH
jgi:hypothetical protein